MSLDFARARRDSFFALFALDEIENFSLPLSQHEPSIGALSGRCKFK
jgi:hypothetical protein